MDHLLLRIHRQHNVDGKPPFPVIVRVVPCDNLYMGPIDTAYHSRKSYNLHEINNYLRVQYYHQQLYTTYQFDQKMSSFVDLVRHGWAMQ